MRCRIFTLIELLVVIAVIAILAAVMLPALSAARERARSVGCVNNLKQIATAYCMYGNDYGFTPAVWSKEARWVNALTGYLAEDKKVWLCPADSRTDDAKKIWKDVDFALSYGINQAYRRDPDFRKKPYLLWHGIAVSLIKSPGEFISVADSGSYYIGQSAAGVGRPGNLNGETVISGGFNGYLALRHNQSKNFNAAFADGHVEGLVYDHTPSRYWDYNNDSYEDFE